MNSYLIVLVLSGVLIATYLVDFASHKIKIPSVLFLLFMGLMLRVFTDKIQFHLPYVDIVLPIFGTIALIMIVLEGALELELSREKMPLISRSLVSSIVLVIVSALGISFLFYYCYHQRFHVCLVNAIPLSVVSSAIAIPSAKNLAINDRDFIVYESSFSDILGIMLFNFVVIHSIITISSVFFFGLELIVICTVSVVLSLFLGILISRIRHHIKFLPILAIVFMVYTTAKMYHFSPLLLILVFGVFLNNSKFISKFKIGKYLNYNNLQNELPFFKRVVAELTFLFRAFFFLLFGFSTPISDLNNKDSFFISTAIVAIIFVSRYLFLKLAFKIPLRPLSLISPRGLISLLMALSIPPQLKIQNFNNSILIWTVFLSVVILSINSLIGQNSEY